MANIDPGPMLQVLKSRAQDLKKKGIDVENLKPMGVGTQGAVYQFGDKILKITGDVAEARASKRIAGKNSPNVVNIFDVFQLKDTKYYCIIQELLTPLSKEEISEFNNALVKSGFLQFYALPKYGAQYDWEKAKKLTIEYILKNLAPKEVGDDFEKRKEFTAKMWHLMTRKYHIKTIAEQMQAMGVNFHDFHGGNLMRKEDGTIVLVDPGLSKLKGKVEEPDVFESLRLMIGMLISEARRG